MKLEIFHPRINEPIFFDAHVLIWIKSGRGIIEVDFKNYTDFEKCQLNRPRSSTIESDATNERSSSFESYLPSEYVNRNSEKKFDARKMGLAKSTFDSALDAMLENTGYQSRFARSEFRHEQYDKFARQAGIPTSRSSRSRSSKGKLERKGSGKKKEERKSKTSKDSWGPEAKVRRDHVVKYLVFFLVICCIYNFNI